jgi:hypothetical protein
MSTNASPLGFLFRTILGVVGVLALMIALAGWAAPRRRPPLEGYSQAKLADGTVASLVRATVGESHDWTPEVERSLWSSFRGRPGVASLSTTFKPGGMLVWVARHDGTASAPLPWPDIRDARLIVGDESILSEQMVVFRSHQHGQPLSPFDGMIPHTTDSPLRPEHLGLPATGMHAIPMVLGFLFPAPPQGSGPFFVELLGERPAVGAPRPVVARLELPEVPGLSPKPAWVAQPLPARSTVGPNTLVLKGFRGGGWSSRGDNEPEHVRHHFQYELDLEAGGQVAPAHLFRNGPVVDLGGNLVEDGYQGGARPCFGPHRLSLTARVPTAPELVESSRRETPDLAIPPDNSARSLTDALRFRDGRIVVSLRAVGGRGTVQYPDPTPSGTVQWGQYGGIENVSYNVRRETNHTGTSRDIRLRVEAKLVHVLFDSTGLTADEWLVATGVVDDQGRAVKFYDFTNHGVRMVLANPEPDAKSLRVAFEVQDAATFEFFVEPPQPVAPK